MKFIGKVVDISLFLTTETFDFLQRLFVIPFSKVSKSAITHVEEAIENL